MGSLASLLLVCGFFGWFVDGLGVVWGWFGWFVGDLAGLAGLWVVSSFTANGT